MRYDFKECALRVVVNLKCKGLSQLTHQLIYILLMGVFFDRHKLCSTAVADCRTGQKKRQILQTRALILARLVGQSSKK